LEVSSNCTPDYSTMENSSNMQTSDGKYKYPAGLMNFTLDCPQAGDTATITQYFYDLSSTGLVARKYNSSTNTYSTIPGATIAQLTIDGHIVTKITYQITDGGPLDQDSTINGIIVDPSGPATVSLSATGATPNTGFGHIIDTNNFTIIASSVLAVLLVGGAYALNKKENK
ncbi:MAG: choice-of-anchor U domain-containing protein, partial [bacterium]